MGLEPPIDLGRRWDSSSRSKWKLLGVWSPEILLEDLRWWVKKDIYLFTPTWGKDRIWLILCRGLKPPTRLGFSVLVLWGEFCSYGWRKKKQHTDSWYLDVYVWQGATKGRAGVEGELYIYIHSIQYTWRLKMCLSGFVDLRGLWTYIVEMNIVFQKRNECGEFSSPWSVRFVAWIPKGSHPVKEWLLFRGYSRFEFQTTGPQSTN